jgi:hypothetical protein
LSISDEATIEAMAKAIYGEHWALRENDIRIRERQIYSQAIQIATRQG